MLTKIEQETLESVEKSIGGHIRLMGDSGFNAACNRLVKKGMLKYTPGPKDDRRFGMWWVPYEKV